MNRTRSASAVIPAYNEESTIASVVAVLKSSPLLRDVIVVSDGSTDHTVEVARSAGAIVYEKPNGGKGEAMLYGLAQTDAPVVLFCDADLRGFTARHVEQLLTPVLNGSLAMNIGRRDRGVLVNLVSARLPLISGERAVERRVLEGIRPSYLQGFMIESTMNYACRSRHLPYSSVLLRGLSMKRKYEKVGWRKALGEYLRMIAQVVKAMCVVRLARLLGRW